MHQVPRRVPFFFMRELNARDWATIRLGRTDPHTWLSKCKQQTHDYLNANNKLKHDNKRGWGEKYPEGEDKFLKQRQERAFEHKKF